MKRYTNYCTEEQVKRAFKLGAPCEVIHDYGDDGCGDGETWDNGHFLVIPTTQQMIGWLVEHEIYIHVLPVGSKENNTFKIDVAVIDKKGNTIFSEWNDVLVTAELAAIDAALDYLNKENKHENN